jgi:hypothetical protein
MQDEEERCEKGGLDGEPGRKCTQRGEMMPKSKNEEAATEVQASKSLLRSRSLQIGPVPH